MKRWRFALSKRWLGYLAVAMIFAIVCVLLANWQLSRRAEREAQIALVAENFDAKPVPLDSLLPDEDSWTESDQWKQVVVEGTYLVEEQLLVRNRPRSGQPGFDVLVPLKTNDGRIFVVDRGWLPTGSEQDLPDVVPDAPQGDVTVTARLKPGERGLAGRGAPDGQIATVELSKVAEATGPETYTGAYGLLVSENPAPQDQAPLAAVKPVPDEGRHLSYAFQWVIFALMAFAFLAYALRQEYRHLHADEPDQQKRLEEEREKRSHSRSDADVEDALLDDYAR